MTKLTDARKTLRGYYAANLAARLDLERIEKFLKLSKDQQQKALSIFAPWFRHHADMYIDVRLRSEREFFFAKLDIVLKDPPFLDDLRTRQTKIMDLRNTIEDDFNKSGMTPELAKHLAAYAKLASDYIDSAETMFVQAVLTHFTIESYKQLEQEYIRAVKAPNSIFLPWIITRLPPEERTGLLGMLPLPLRLIYTYIWEPAYKKHYNFVF